MSLNIFAKFRKSFVSDTEGLMDAKDVDVDAETRVGPITSAMTNLKQALLGLASQTIIGLSVVLQHLGRDLVFQETNEAGVNDNYILFPDADGQKPVSIDYFNADNTATDDITGDSTGLTIDTFDMNARPNAEISSLGGIALRGELTIQRGEADNWRRIVTWTSELQTVRAVRSGILRLGRKVPANSYHSVLYLIKVGANVFLQWPAFLNNAVHYTNLIVDRREDRNGNRLSDQAFHFQQADVVKFGVIFESTNVADAEQDVPLRMIVVAERYDEQGTFLETIYFRSVQQIIAGQPNAGAILNNVNWFQYNRMQLYAGDANGAFNCPIVGVETIQYTTTTPADHILHHTDLASRMRAAITATHKLLGFYATRARSFYRWLIPVRLAAGSTTGVRNLHLGVKNVEGNDAGAVASTGLVNNAYTWNTQTGNQALRFDEDFADVNIPDGVAYNEANGEIVFPAGVWLLCLSLKIRNNTNNDASWQNTRLWGKLQIREGAADTRHSNEVYSRWGYRYRSGGEGTDAPSSAGLSDFYQPAISVSGVVVSDGVTPVTTRIKWEAQAAGGLQVLAAHLHAVEQA